MSPNPEICPKCQSKEIDTAGICLVCGTSTDTGPAVEIPTSPKEDQSVYRGLITMDCPSSGESEPSEIPEWRQELSRRLSEIRRKRGLEVEDQTPALPFPQEEHTPALPAAHESRESAPASERAKPVVRRRQPSRVPDRPVLKPVESVAHKAAENSPPLGQQAQPKIAVAVKPEPDVRLHVAPVTRPEADSVQNLIDRAVSRQPAEAASQPDHTAPLPDREGEDKLILLTRILSGLIDLLIIGICTGSFVVAADMFSGINVVDNVSLFYYGVLLLATFFVYSAFFLGTANQTVGMMIKDLRIVGINGERPRIGQVMGRCAAYLVSWLILGIGLGWAAFDRDAMCLHDKLSRTRVVRL